MKLSTLAGQAQKLLIDNSPQVLTAVGVVGVVSTAVLTGRASVKAYTIIEANDVHVDPLTSRDKFNLTWKCFVPPVTTGALTIASIVGSSHISASRAAGLAAAYSLSERAFEEYSRKVVERMGVKGEQKVRDEIAQERVTREPGNSREIIIAGTEVLCCDAFSGRYFNANIETIKKAQNDINYRLMQDGYASLSDFYDLIDLSPTDGSDEVGWTIEQQVDLAFSTTLTPDGRPCLVFSFRVRPIRNYYRMR